MKNRKRYYKSAKFSNTALNKRLAVNGTASQELYY
jgi:hypothetical protein